jgi:hypothetical protein
MIALLALSGAFVAPLPSRAAARARMAADDAPAPSDRYTMADPTGLLRSFFTGEKRQKKNAGFYTGLDADGEIDLPTARLSANAANRLADAELDLAQASASDLAAALVAQRGRAEAESLLTSALESVRNDDWGGWADRTSVGARFFKTQKPQKQKFYSGL